MNESTVAKQVKYDQGVFSEIILPLGQDEVAVSRAIHDLFREGWEFFWLNKTHICLRRIWEA